jgi:ABC-type antimicrobial peptide transport system permease subunit
VRGLGTSFLVRRAMSTWLMLACVAVTVLVATVLAAALWTFEAEAMPLGTRDILAASPDRSVAVASAPGQPVSGDAGVIRARLGAAWPGVGYQMESALWSRPIPLRTPPGSQLTTQIQAAALEGIQAQAVLTAGSWPGPPRPHAPLPAALPVTVARQLNLGPGSVLKLASHAHGAALGLRITGLFRPRNPASPYWALDLLPLSGMRILPLPFAGVSYGPAVVSPAAFSGGLATGQASWSVLPQAAALARGNLSALAASTSQAATYLTTFTRPYGLQVTTGLPRLLSDVNRSVVLARSLFTIGTLQLLLVTAAGLALAARLLAGYREGESALLRARGAAKSQLTRPVLAEALGLGALAAAVGVPVGARLASALVGQGRLRSAGYPVARIAPLVWVSAFAVLALCVVVMAWPALRSASPDAARAGRTRQARLAGIARVGGDLALAAIAVLAVWELHDYSAVARPVSGTLGIDPVVAVAPALALAGVALVPLRALPLLARLTDKATKRGRRLAAAIVSWQIGRRPVRQAGPVLLAVVAAATSTLALAGYASWHRSAADQAAYAVGADVRLVGPGSPGEAGAIAAAPGVTAATPASVVTLGSGGQGQMMTISGTTTPGPRLIALDASTAGATIALRPDLSPLPLSALWRRITPQRLAGLPIPGRPARLKILVSLAAETGPQRFGGAGVIAWLQDGGGGTYQMGTCPSPLAYLPADGRQHTLIIPLAGPGQAVYPLRLLGLSLCYILPPFDAAHPLASPALALRVLALAAARTPAGPFAPPFARGAALASWRATASAQTDYTRAGLVPVRPPGSFGGPVLPQDGTPPEVRVWHRAGAGSQQLGFLAGHAPSAGVLAQTSTIYGNTYGGQATIMPRPPFPAVPANYVATITGNTPLGGATTHVSLLPGSHIAGIPAIATNSYLSRNHVRIGSTVPFVVGGALVPIRIVASVTAFPTTSPASQVLIVDLAAVQDLLVTDQAMPLPVTQWWLRTSHGQVPRRLPPGLSATDLARQEAALLHDPLSVAPRQAMLAIGAAAVLLAALGFSASVAASVRERRTQSAVLAALGVGRRAQAGHLCLEQLLLSVPAAAVGLLAGIGLARLLVPSITLAANAADPVPSALVILPLGQAAALALIIAAVPVAAAAVSVTRRLDPAAQLRAEAG